MSSELSSNPITDSRIGQPPLGKQVSWVELSGEHPLETSWVFWFNDKRYQLETAMVPFVHKLVPLGEVETVEDFFRAYSYIKRPNEMPVNVELRFFRKTEVPMWEHSPKGGCWIVKFWKDQNINQKWEKLLFACIGERFNDLNVIGVVLSIRPKTNILQVWLKDRGLEGDSMHVLKIMQDVLGADFSKDMIYFKDNHKAMIDNSTLKNVEGFKLVKVKNDGGKAEESKSSENEKENEAVRDNKNNEQEKNEENTILESITKDTEARALKA